MAAGLQGMLDKAVAAHRRGELDAAERGYLTILKAMPRHFGALQFMGALAVQRRRYEQADQLLARALEIEPRHVGALINHSIALQALNQVPEALATVDRALTINPRDPLALNNRGNILQRTGRENEALASFDLALSVQPGYLDALCNRANLLLVQSRLDEALQGFMAALAKKSNHASALQGCGDVLLRLGRHDEAIGAYQAALRHGGNESRIKLALAALGVGEQARTSPDKFVRELFDNYADRFDDELVNKLGYRTPTLIADAVKRLRPGASLDIADLGCGTGLCGKLLKPPARTLIGIDLSSNMLEKARELRIYDALHCVEIVQWLQAELEGTFDAVIAADVFVYVGDLEAVFAQARRVLRDGGLFGFSVESVDGDGFTLRTSLRFGHSEHYLRRLADVHGFRTEIADRHALRREGGATIEGILVMLSR